MNLSEQLLADLALYGTPLLFGITVIACAGVPLPASLLLIAAGSFADHGEMNGAAVIGFASFGAVLGDQIGYMFGRWGDRALSTRVSRWLGSEARLAEAEAHARKWGGTGVFFTRWLATPLGPFINIASGFTHYSWFRFLLWDILGEVLWVGLYVSVGEVFGHRVQMLSGVLAQITWAGVALFVGVVLAWMLWRRT